VFGTGRPGRLVGRFERHQDVAVRARECRHVLQRVADAEHLYVNRFLNAVDVGNQGELLIRRQLTRSAPRRSAWPTTCARNGTRPRGTLTRQTSGRLLVRCRFQIAAPHAATWTLPRSGSATGNGGTSPVRSTTDTSPSAAMRVRFFPWPSARMAAAWRPDRRTGRFGCGTWRRGARPPSCAATTTGFVRSL